MLDRIDLFKKNIPTFNMRGRTTVASWPGGILSFSIFFIILIYATLKMLQLISRKNPNVSSYIEKNFFDSSHRVNFKEDGIRFAFGIEGFIDHNLKLDSRYVKNLVRFWGKKGGVEYEKLLPYHKCTADDFDEFAPPQPEAVGMLEAITDSEMRGLFCPDWDVLDNEMEIWSIEDDDDYQRIDIVLLPCNYLHFEFGDTGDTIAPECIADLKE